MNKIQFIWLLLPAIGFCSTLPPDTTLVGAYSSSGLYNLVGIGTWNGQPLGPGNFPTDTNRELDASINFFVSSSSPSNLFVQLEGVTTTIGAFWFGAAFDNVTQTGIQIIFPASFGPATLNANFANPRQVLVDGTSGSEVVSPLTSTPGYTLLNVLDDYIIVTASGADEGFTSLGGIFGARRIRGGGLFELQFNPSVNLFNVDFSKVNVFSLYGDGGANQSIEAFATLAPEPSDGLLLSIGFLAILKYRRSRSQDRQRSSRSSRLAPKLSMRHDRLPY
jgi:hypothetical protein